MNIYPGPYLFLLAGLLISCREYTGDNTSSEIEQILADLIAADNRKDIDFITGIYAPDAVLMPPGGKPIIGHSAITRHYQDLFADFDFHNLKLVSEEIIVQGNWAVSAGTTGGEIILTANDSAIQVDDKYIMMFKKDRNNAWKISRLIWNRN